MRLLVTGGAGFIGSHFVRAAASWATHITVLDALTYAGNIRNLDSVIYGDNVSFINGDITLPEDCAKAMEGHDAVVHFAAESHVDRSVTDSDVFVQTNIVGTHNLLHAAHGEGVKRFVHVSTDEVYGSTVYDRFTESSPLNPSNPYAASKAASDMLALAYQRTHGLPVVVTRCTNNYGANQHPEKVIPRWVRALSQGHPIEIHGDGHNVREWIHVSDHVHGIVLALNFGRAGQVYNIGGGIGLNNITLARSVVSALGLFDADSVIRHIPDRASNDFRYALDDSKAREELGYRPRVPFTRGLEGVVRWYRDHPQWWESDTN